VVGVIDRNNTHLVGDAVVSADRGLVELMFFREADRGHTHQPLDNRPAMEVETRRKRVGNAPPPPDWHPVRVTLGNGSFAASYHGLPFAAVDPARSLRTLCLADGLPPATFPGGLGNGIGLFAVDGEVLFRNVRVVPPPPDPPR
jgi:hypothetical protein